MRKLKLDLDDLTVEAFDTVTTHAPDGTVVGYGPTLTAQCGSCWISCNGTCPLPCTGGFYSECCTGDGCNPTFDYSCGEACTVSCPPE